MHNGVIENYRELRAELEGRGFCFASDTDTEVVPQLINCGLSEGMDPQRAVRFAGKLLIGKFCACDYFEDRPDLLIAVRKDSPLVIGFGEKGTYVSSDEVALAFLVKNVLYLEDRGYRSY